MGANLVITRKNSPADGSFEAEQNDHKLMVAFMPQLKKMAAALQVKDVKDFFDEAGAEYEMYEEIHGQEAPENWLEENRKWFDPAEALVSLEAIIDYIKREKPAYFKVGYAEALLIELKDCVNLLQGLKEDGDQFCFSMYL